MRGSRHGARWVVFILTVLLCGARAETRILCTAKGEGAGGTAELYTLRADGSDLRRLTENAFTEWGPALSPDRHTVAYLRPDMTGGNIRLFSLRGGVPVAVGNHREARAVQWLDDDTLVFLRVTGAPVPGFYENFEIWRVDTDGTDELKVYDGEYAGWPANLEAFSIDHRADRIHFAFFLTNALPVSVLRSGPVGGPVEDMTFPVLPPLGGFSHHFSPVVSPDGNELAYCADLSNGLHRLYVAPMAPPRTTVTMSDEYCGTPAWSPDGSWLAFVRGTNATLGLTTPVGDICVVARRSPGAVTVLTSNLVVAGGCAFPTVYEEAVAPSIVALALAGEAAVVTWTATNTAHYTLQYRACVTDSAWNPVPFNTGRTGVDGYMTGTDNVHAARQRLYRILVE